MTATYSVIYFSPTGNTAYLTKLLAAYLDPAEVTVLPLESTDAQSLEAADHLVLLFPIHAFNAPGIVKQFADAIPAGLFLHTSLIAVGSADMWMNAAASREVRQILERKGYPAIIDEVLAMPVTIVMKLGRETAQKTIHASVQKLAEISVALQSNDPSQKTVPTKAKLINALGKAEAIGGRLFGLELHASDACISCGTCWENCPAGNITEGKDGNPHFGFKCAMCMRCIYNCPTQAISPRFSKFVPIKGGYSLTDYVDED